MAYTIRDLEKTNPEYARNRNRWQFLADSYHGGADYARGGYLTRYVYESGDEYEDRIAQTPLDNHCRSIISIYNSFIFATSPRRHFNDLKENPLITNILEDADFEGRSWDSFMREVNTQASIYGHAWVIVDRPAVEVMTRADEISGGVRPYVSLYSAVNVLDWQYQRNLMGRFELIYLKTLEYEDEDSVIVNLFYPDHVDRVRYQRLGREGEIISSTPNPLGYIPGVCVYSQRSSVRGIGISDINDIADVQRSIYDELSEIEQLIRISNHPSLVSTQDVQAQAGAGARIIIQDNTDSGLKPYLLQPNSQSLDGIRASIRDKIDAINKMANVASVRATETRTASGVALETEMRLLNAHLTQKADNLELAEEQIWTIILEWMGYVNAEFEIDYPESFNTRDRMADLAMIEKAKMVLALPTTGNGTVDMILGSEALKVLDLHEHLMREIEESYERGEFDESVTDVEDEEDEEESRQYPDGEPIDPRLPEAYQPASTAGVPEGQNCANCEYYQQGQCSAWGGATVRPIYWCARWEALEQEEE
jgi:hypothetical protein